jgi:S-adenosylmethionine hydrolase
VEERGEVTYVDGFGNVVTNIPPREGAELKRMEAARSHAFDRIELTYGSVPAGTALLLVGSLGFLEIAVNRGNASRDLDLRPGDRVVALWKERR